jgi:hypothetical protein
VQTLARKTPERQKPALLMRSIENNRVTVTTGSGNFRSRFVTIVTIYASALACLGLPWLALA